MGGKVSLTAGSLSLLILGFFGVLCLHPTTAFPAPPKTQLSCPKVLRKVLRKGRQLGSDLAQCRVDLRKCKRQKTIVAKARPSAAPVILIAITGLGVGVVLGLVVGFKLGKSTGK